MSKSMITDGFNGKVITLMSTDIRAFDDCVVFVHYLWKGPIELMVFGYLIYRELDLYGLVGAAFILSLVPIQSTFIYFYLS